uniref:RNA 2-O ribose methyltransferase substrate binding domain-containing protein n=1 Tax=Phlebotomus papatasi TaxID=29031 RepID=A0A1B0DIJ4_PHLPP
MRDDRAKKILLKPIWLIFSSALGFPKEVTDVEKLEEDLFGREIPQNWTEKREKRYRHQKKPKSTEKSQNTDGVDQKIDKSTNLAYRDLKFRDPIIRDTMMLLRSGKRQKKGQLLLLEGRRLIEDALKSNMQMKKLFFSRPEELEELSDLLKYSPHSQLFRVTYRDLSLWSQLTTSPGILAIFERPTSIQSRPKNILPISVICDNIREPNNLGSVIRICAALPCREVLVMKGCTDPFDGKSLRGGAGGQFHVPLRYPVNWEDLQEILPEDNSVFVAENNVEKALNFTEKKPLDVAEFFLPEQNPGHHMTLIIGGETHGISEEGYRLMKLYKNSACLHIPLSECVESLNTASALAVILFELRRKLLEKRKLENYVQEEK